MVDCGELGLAAGDGLPPHLFTFLPIFLNEQVQLDSRILDRNLIILYICNHPFQFFKVHRSLLSKCGTTESLSNLETAGDMEAQVRLEVCLAKCNPIQPHNPTRLLIPCLVQS